MVATLPDARTVVADLSARSADDRPDVIVLDVRMPPTFTNEGLLCAIDIRQRFCGIGVLVFSQYVETRFAADLLAGDARGVGYLLKDRVVQVSAFTDALARIANGETVMDPEVVAQLMGARQADRLHQLTPREREVLALMAEGRSNSAIGASLYLSDGAVEKNISSIFAKLGLPPTAADNRRVLAVLHYLGAASLSG